MLIDSHCHLEYEGLVEDQQGVLERARAAGVGGFLNISTRAERMGTGRRHRRARARCLGQRRHPSARGRRSCRSRRGGAARGVRAPQGDRHRRNRARLLLRQVRPRRCSRQLFRMHIGVARETGLPLIIHTRDAEDDTPQSCAEEMGKGAFPALIHCFTASAGFGRNGARSGADDLAFGHRDFQECQGTAGIRDGNSRQIACWSKPTARSSRRCRIAARPASRPLSPTPRAFVAELRGETRREAWRRQRPRNFYALFQKARGVKLIDARFRHLDRGAADRQRLGRMRSREPKNRRTRVSIMVESDAGIANCWSILRPICASSCSTTDIDRIDGVFWTHDHADHCHGIDDLRVDALWPRARRCRDLPRRKRCTGCVSASAMSLPGNMVIPRSSASKTLDRLKMHRRLRCWLVPDAAWADRDDRIPLRSRWQIDRLCYRF